MKVEKLMKFLKKQDKNGEVWIRLVNSNALVTVRNTSKDKISFDACLFENSDFSK